jgi:hypothetical protein
MLCSVLWPTTLTTIAATHFLDLVAPLRECTAHLLYCDGAAAIRVNGLEQLTQTWQQQQHRQS